MCLQNSSVHKLWVIHAAANLVRRTVTDWTAIIAFETVLGTRDEKFGITWATKHTSNAALCSIGAARERNCKPITWTYCRRRTYAADSRFQKPERAATSEGFWYNHESDYESRSTVVDDTLLNVLRVIFMALCDKYRGTATSYTYVIAFWKLKRY